MRACESIHKSVCEIMTDWHEFIPIKGFKVFFQLRSPITIDCEGHKGQDQKAKQNLFSPKNEEEGNCQNHSPV